MVDHVSNEKDRRNKWLIFFLSLVVPFYFLYILIKLYNTHDFSDSEPKHKNFSWNNKSLAFLILVILVFVGSIALIVLSYSTGHSLMIGPNYSMQTHAMVAGSILVLSGLLFILSIVALILEINMITKLMSTHYFEDGFIKHKPSDGDSFILWLIVCLIFPLATLYLEYKISEIYANHMV